MANPTTFFLVDDDTDDVSLFRDVAAELHTPVAVVSAENGLEALQLLRTANPPRPDVIFLDLNMPRMDGKECLKQLKEDEVLQHIPVIMYTTSSQSRDIEETMQKGAVCFITKPSSIKDLKSILGAIAESGADELLPTLRRLSNTANTFIVC